MPVLRTFENVLINVLKRPVNVSKRPKNVLRTSHVFTQKEAFINSNYFIYNICDPNILGFIHDLFSK